MRSFPRLARALRSVKSAALRSLLRAYRHVWKRPNAPASLSLAFEVVRRLVTVAWKFGRWVATAMGSALRWLLLPRGDTPFDALKHYMSVIVGVVGLLALLWAGKQIYNPPIVITVADLPKPIGEEYWLNTQIARTLIDQIERMRTIVKGERDPNFETVLNPPNIVVKSGDWSFNVQEQIVVPLGSLLGRSHGEVHLALTCYHPGCLRTRDSDCQVPVSAQKAGAEDVPKETLPQANQYLCLRMVADIRRGKVHKRVTTRLSVNNQTFEASTSKEMARIAEELTALADPATAAIYFYLRARQEDQAARGALTGDAGRVADLRAEVFKAAGQAEAQDAVSACWAHSVRARMAIDRREYSLAETYISRANGISWWRHLRQLTLPTSCRRLIAVAETAFARRIAPPALAQLRIHPLHRDDNNEVRRQAAFRRISRVIDELGGSSSSLWWARLENAVVGETQTDVARFARAEIGLHLFPKRSQCESLADALPAIQGANNARAVEINLLRLRARVAIRIAIARIEAIRPAQRPAPTVRQAALDFSQQLARNKGCLAKATSLAEHLYHQHPDDPGAARLLAFVMEQNALSARAEDEGDQKYLNRARELYARMVEIGDDRIFALGRLALIETAFESRWQTDDEDLTGPDRRTLESLRQAWARYERDNYPNDVRLNIENVLVLWGSVLLTSYPAAIVSADLSTVRGIGDTKQDSAARDKGEFLQAAQILFPGATAKSLSDLVKLKGLGPRIGCLCVLFRMAGNEENNKAEYFLTKADQGLRPFGWRSQAVCGSQFLPRSGHPSRAAKETQLANAKKYCHVEEKK